MPEPIDQTNNTNRIVGLDTLRAFAICLVMMTHYSGFVSHQQTFGLIGSIGRAGVDLFFVLSGYLIGNQIVASIANGQAWSLKTFFARRLLRTLPNYYVVLIIYLLLPEELEGKNTASIWHFLTFTQNFGLAYGDTFTHSWSLCVEEQFYLFLPLAILAIKKFSDSPRALWLFLGVFVGIGIVLRGVASMKYGYDSFSAEVYYSTFARFDELLFGVAISVLKNFHPDTYQRLMRRGNVLLVVGLFGAIAVFVSFAQDFPNTFITTAFGFSLLAFNCMLLTLAALSPNSLLNRLRLPGAAAIARWSYAIYLAHKPLFMLISPHLEQLGIDANSVPVVMWIFFVGVLGGWILYRTVELPFMRLRARWFG